MEKIIITKKQVEQFNQMRRILERISNHYMTVDQVIKNAKRKYGLNPQEALEMSYENMQSEAKLAIEGVNLIKLS